MSKLYAIQLYTRNDTGKRNKLVNTIKYSTWAEANDAKYALAYITKQKSIKVSVDINCNPKGYAESTGFYNLLIVGPTEINQL